MVASRASNRAGWRRSGLGPDRSLTWLTSRSGHEKLHARRCLVSATMDAIDVARLKSGEVDLGVRWMQMDQC